MSRRIYTYHINLDEQNAFNADVRDSTGKTVFAIDSVDQLDLLVSEGYIEDKADLKSISDYLKTYVGVLATSDQLTWP